IIGSAGSGKSRILEEFLSLGRSQGFRTVRLQFEERDALTPYSAIRQLIAELLELRGALAVAPASLQLLMSAVSVDKTISVGASENPTFPTVVSELLTNVATEGPLLIALDDADHVDARSLELMRVANASASSEVLGFILSS